VPEGILKYPALARPKRPGYGVETDMDRRERRRREHVVNEYRIGRRRGKTLQKQGAVKAGRQKAFNARTDGLDR
jgi:hypothetical protein